jgi:hypothetical protein
MITITHGQTNVKVLAFMSMWFTSNNFGQMNIHPAHVLHPFALTPLLNLHSHFWCIALWLATFCYANLLFMTGLSF